MYQKEKFSYVWQSVLMAQWRVVMKQYFIRSAKCMHNTSTVQSWASVESFMQIGGSTK